MVVVVGLWDGKTDKITMSILQKPSPEGKIKVVNESINHNLCSKTVETWSLKDRDFDSPIP